MRCPFCAEADTRVIDSRLGGEGFQVRRRRECPGCKARFNTFESAELNLPRVIKSDSRREPYDRQKLETGLSRALEKRPVATERIEEAVIRIERRLRESGEREIGTRQIGDWVMEELRGLDKVAYVRFASVYRSFEDLRAFLDEIERLEQELPVDVTEPNCSANRKES